MNGKFQLWSCCPLVLGSLENVVYLKTGTEQTAFCCHHEAVWREGVSPRTVSPTYWIKCCTDHELKQLNEEFIWWSVSLHILKTWHLTFMFQTSHPVYFICWEENEGDITADILVPVYLVCLWVVEAWKQILKFYFWLIFRECTFFFYLSKWGWVIDQVTHFVSVHSSSTGQSSKLNKSDLAICSSGLCLWCFSGENIFFSFSFYCVILYLFKFLKSL